MNNLIEQRLVCAFFQDLNFTNVGIINHNFDELEKEITFMKGGAMRSYLRMQRINLTHIKFFINSSSWEIFLDNNQNEINYLEQKFNEYYKFVYFSALKDLLYYHNQFIFYYTGEEIRIRRNISNNYVQILNKDGKITKLMGYFNEERDILIFIYQLTSQHIKYFYFQNLSSIFFVKTQLKEYKIVSYTKIIYNISELFIKDSVVLNLSLLSLSYFPNIHTSEKTYDYYNFNEENQTLVVNPRENDWVYFDFYYKEETNPIFPASFISENFRVLVKTCSFKCDSCNTTFDNCSYLHCKEKFGLLQNGSDTECYSNEQIFPNYIFNSNNNKYELCYPTCKFCTDNEYNSNNDQQNCRVCNEGYLRSYTFLKNCYEIEDSQRNSEYCKIVNQSNEKYEVIDSCENINKYKIQNTGECVDECPISTPYYNYYRNSSVNFTKQEEQFIGYLYELDLEFTPRYLFNKVCYTNCPKLTYENSNKCNCSNAWEYNSTNEYMICYSYKHCNSLDYYYHTDTKECVLYGCKENYYLINYECYPNECPYDSVIISENRKECNFTLDFCYIDDDEDLFRTKCFDEIDKESSYKLRYNDSNLYFKNCNYSLKYYNITTYLYRYTCYQFCPVQTIKNETNKKCSCLFYIYYVNKEEDDYECLKENEKCFNFKNDKKYPILNKKECVDSLQDCIKINYKIFNEECFEFCPDKTELKEENGHFCFCKYHYYNKSNFLTCFDEGKTCESLDYPIKMDNTKECFKTKDECINRGFKLFNNICYENSCPENSYNKNNNGICYCSYYFVNQLNNLICFGEGVECKEASSTYTYNYIDKKECISSLEECDKRGLKIYEGECYDNCPKNTKEKDNGPFCIYITEKSKLIDFIINIILNGIKSISDTSYYELNLEEILNDNEIVVNIDNKDTFKRELITEIKNISIINLIIEQKRDFILRDNNILYQFTSTYNQKNNKYDNISTLILGDCEKKLKQFYNISENESLIIFMNSIYVEGFSIPIIEYEVYDLERRNLNLSICKGMSASIFHPFLNEDNNLFKYNSSDKYYNDICYIYTSDKKTDFILEDRRKEFTDKNLSLCEKECKYKGINQEKKIKCDCIVKIKLPLINEIEINKDKFLKDFTEIKKLLNLNIMKCYSVLFTKDGIKKNIGSYCILSIITANIILLILFLVRGKKLLFKKIRKLAKLIKENIKNKEIKTTNDINNSPFKVKKKKSKSKKKRKNYNIMNINKNIIKNISINNINIENINNINKENIRDNNTKDNLSSKSKIISINKFNNPLINNPPKKCRNTNNEEIMDETSSKREIKISNNLIKEESNKNTPKQLIKEQLNSKNLNIYQCFNDYELNYLCYEDALRFDKRTYIQYYLSLLRMNHILIFSFYTYNDYNSKIIKICLFLFSVSLYFTINTLFYTDEVIHKIYVENGNINFIYRLPKILYSNIIISLINMIVSFFSLSQKNILELKNEKKHVRTKARKIKRCLKIKFIIFFILLFLLLILFWYYLSCFCTIYRNTQIHLMKDISISLGLSFLYPLGLNFIPGLIRIPSLRAPKSDKKLLYRISLIFQLI